MASDVNSCTTMSEFTETAIVAVHPQRALRCPDFLMASYADQEEECCSTKIV